VNAGNTQLVECRFVELMAVGTWFGILDTGCWSLRSRHRREKQDTGHRECGAWSTLWQRQKY